MKSIDVTEFMKDAMELSDDYQSMNLSGFRSEKNLLKILDPFMQKYGFTQDEALAVARGTVTYAQIYHAFRRGNGKVF